MIIKITFSISKNKCSGGMMINSKYHIGFGITRRNQGGQPKQYYLFQNSSNHSLTRVLTFSQTGLYTHCHTNVKNLRLFQTNVNSNRHFINNKILKLKEDQYFSVQILKMGNYDHIKYFNMYAQTIKSNLTNKCFLQMAYVSPRKVFF